jgi:hypothetical protein
MSLVRMLLLVLILIGVAAQEGSAVHGQDAIKVDPDHISVVAGDSKASSLIMEGISGCFVFNASNTPQGMTIAFSPPTVDVSSTSPPFVSRILVLTQAELQPGKYPIQINAIEVPTNRTLNAEVEVEVLSSIDLFPEGIEWTPVRPATNDSVTFRVSVRNQGYVAANVEVAFLVDNAPLSNMTDTIYPRQALVYQSKPWPAPHPVTEEERHSVTVLVDPHKLVEENDETNNNSTGFFFVDSKKYTVTINAVGLQDRELDVRVNGASSAKISEGKPASLSFDSAERAVIETDACVLVSDTERLCTAQSKWEVSSETPGVITLQFYPQYVVKIDTHPSYAPEPTVLPRGVDCEAEACWYATKQTIYLYLAPEVLPQEGVRISLKQIQMDERDFGVTQLFPVPVDGYHVIHVVYERQFRLQVETAYSEVSGNGWYNEDSPASWSLKQPQVQMDLCGVEWLTALCPARIQSTSNTTSGTYDKMTQPVKGFIAWSFDWPLTVLANLLRVPGPAGVLALLVPPVFWEKKLRNRVSVYWLIPLLLWVLYVSWAFADLNGWVFLVVLIAALALCACYKVLRSLRG